MDEFEKDVLLIREKVLVRLGLSRGSDNEELETIITEERMAFARDGSHVNMMLASISIDGLVLTIRKFPKNSLTMQQLIAMGRSAGTPQSYYRYWSGRIIA